MTPYYADGSVTLWHGEMRQILPGLDVTADCVVTDPPYRRAVLIEADERYCEVIARRLAQNVLPMPADDAS